MNPKDIQTPADVARWLKHYVEWSSEASRDMMLRAVAVLSEPWEDKMDGWSKRVAAAHPARSGSHDEWVTAMKMVGNRHSKGELVALVNWLLVENRTSRSGRPAV